VQNEADAERITCDTLRDTAEKFVVRLQRVHQAEGSHTEHVFTRRRHAHKVSTKLSFHSCINASVP
jgi:hypothetical protein